ncbi:unnamed protein product [Boreogadus saida]
MTLLKQIIIHSHNNDLSSVELFSPSIQPLHPVIYATGLVLLVCMLTIIISYVHHHRPTAAEISNVSEDVEK